MLQNDEYCIILQVYNTVKKGKKPSIHKLQTYIHFLSNCGMTCCIEKACFILRQMGQWVTSQVMSQVNIEH